MNWIKETFKKIVNNRSVRYGSNSVILIAVVLAIAVLVNVLVSMSSLKLDLTVNKLYTIGDTTKEILTKLNKDVTVYGLIDEGKIGSSPDMKEVTELLSQYTKYAHIKLSYVDPDKNPGIIKQLDPQGIKGIQSSDFVFKSGNNVKRVSYNDLFDVQQNQDGSSYKNASKAEQSFTGAIKYVTADVTPTVYFTTGHQEKTVDNDYKNVQSFLSQNAFDVKTINLTTEAKVPDDAQILMVASPKTDLSTAEEQKIKDYLKNGGKAVFLFDSLDTDPSFPQFEDILKDYNISLNYDRVKENDNNKHPPNNPYDIIPELQQNDINTNLQPNNFVMIMPKSRSLNVIKDQKQFLTVTSLLKTSASAVGEQISASRGKEIPGPLDLAIAAEYTGTEKASKVLVIGNGSFIDDTGIQKYNQYSVQGMYFFLNSVMWMQDKKDDNIVAPKTYDAQQLNINATQANIVSASVVVVLPLLILGFGIFVWMRRRHL